MRGVRTGCRTRPGPLRRSGHRRRPRRRSSGHPRSVFPSAARMRHGAPAASDSRGPGFFRPQRDALPRPVRVSAREGRLARGTPARAAAPCRRRRRAGGPARAVHREGFRRGVRAERREDQQSEYRGRCERAPEGCRAGCADRVAHRMTVHAAGARAKRLPRLGRRPRALPSTHARPIAQRHGRDGPIVSRSRGRSMRGLLAPLTLVVLGAACGSPCALAAPPVVTALTPDSGPAAGASAVSISGSGFTAGAQVTFAGRPAAAVQVLSGSSLTALSPPGSGTVEVRVVDSNGLSPASPHDWFAYEPAAGGLWLGLDGNSTSGPYDNQWLGPADEFSRDGIVYDRDFDLTAGSLPRESEPASSGGNVVEDRLRLDHEYGMIPVSVIEFSGYTGDLQPDPAFPAAERTAAEQAQGRTTVAQYVAGFIRTASSLLSIAAADYPGMPVLLEPMNEPWGYTTPRDNGAQYAQVIAALLPAARAAGIPPADIYVSAFGADGQPGPGGAAQDLAPGWIPAMYAAEPSLQSEIQGWYFHPYGPASGTEFSDSEGIQSLPAVRAQMTSGQDNIIVSEVGYCAHSEGDDCHESGKAEVQTRRQAASALTQMLYNALPYREAGWLRALIVYGRGDGGWSMQDYATRGLTAQGEALRAFALAHGGGEPDGCQDADPFSFPAVLASPATAPFSAPAAGCGAPEAALPAGS